jgi:hypothetical protein
MQIEWFFFWGAKLCQNAKNKHKYINIMSKYFLYLKKKFQFSKRNVVNYFGPHLDSDFSLVAFF